MTITEEINRANELLEMLDNLEFSKDELTSLDVVYGQTSDYETVIDEATNRVLKKLKSKVRAGAKLAKRKFSSPETRKTVKKKVKSAIKNGIKKHGLDALRYAAHAMV